MFFGRGLGCSVSVWLSLGCGWLVLGWDYELGCAWLAFGLGLARAGLERAGVYWVLFDLGSVSIGCGFGLCWVWLG